MKNENCSYEKITRELAEEFFKTNQNPISKVVLNVIFNNRITMANIEDARNTLENLEWAEEALIQWIENSNTFDRPDDSQQEEAEFEENLFNLVRKIKYGLHTKEGFVLVQNNEKIIEIDLGEASFEGSTSEKILVLLSLLNQNVNFTERDNCILQVLNDSEYEQFHRESKKLRALLKTRKIIKEMCKDV